MGQMMFFAGVFALKYSGPFFQAHPRDVWNRLTHETMVPIKLF